MCRSSQEESEVFSFVTRLYVKYENGQIDRLTPKKQVKKLLELEGSLVSFLFQSMLIKT